MSAPSGSGKKKIAILGGGVGAMAAAYALTDYPGWQDRYEIDVYQLGWRLGGKGASGRGRVDRVEEHGLHIWFGFYNNAFNLMRGAYGYCAQHNLTPGSPFASWEDAFKKHSLLTAVELVNNVWKPWHFRFPTNDLVPGDPGVLLKPWDYVRMLLRWLLDRHEQATHAAIPQTTGPLSTYVDQVGNWVQGVIGAKVSAVRALLEGEVTVQDSIDLLLYRAYELAQSLPNQLELHPAVAHTTLVALVEDYANGLYAQVQQYLDDDDLRRHWILADIAAAWIKGMIRDDVVIRGFDCIDKYDYVQWLKRHGCRNTDSSLIRGMYDLVFAYEKGNIQKPNFAAGAALRALLKIMLTYKGAIVWKMQAGMGDTVFSPLYYALKHRGVRFHFFHNIRKLGLSADKTKVETIDIDIQATAKTPPYDPIVTVKGLPCWPSHPKYDDLVEGDALRQAGTDLESAWCPTKVGSRQLKRGTDFDQVVLGISIGALPHLCGDLIQANTDWQNMVSQVQTVQTQAFQVWMNRTDAQLGWDQAERAVVGAYVEPLDTWADMTQVLDKESWPQDQNVKNIAYFCGVLDEPQAIPPFDVCTFPAQERDRAKQYALEFLTRYASGLWPLVADPNNPPGLDWNVLADLDAKQGAARFDSQYWRANINPTDRYALSIQNTTQFRLGADESGFENLVLAGDWTYNGINLGCVEAAAISGLQAARALSGHPANIIGERDFDLD